MGRPSPTDDDGSFANPRRRRFRQANGHDVLLVRDILRQPDDGNVVLVPSKTITTFCHYKLQHDICAICNEFAAKQMDSYLFMKCWINTQLTKYNLNKWTNLSQCHKQITIRLWNKALCIVYWNASGQFWQIRLHQSVVYYLKFVYEIDSYKATIDNYWISYGKTFYNIDPWKVAGL